MFNFSDSKKYRSDKMNSNDLNGGKEWGSSYGSSYNPMEHRQVHPNQNHHAYNHNHHAQHNQQHMPYMSQQQIRNQPYQGCNSIQLNPNAEVFVPRGNYQQQTQYNDYYSNNGQQTYGNNQPNYFQNYSSNNMTNYDSEEAAYEAMYGQFGCDVSSALFVPSHDLQYFIRESKNSMELNEIQVGLEQLISDDDFESWSGAIKERMTCANMTNESRILAIKIACEMATAVSPEMTRGAAPQYTFARLLAYLADEIPDFIAKCILPTVESLHSSRYSRDIAGKGVLLMFFAELFVNLKTNKGTAVKPLGLAVFGQMEEIIKDSVCNETMSVIIQVLKLSGSELDTIDEGQEKMNQILTKLNGFVNGHRQLSETIKARISDVIDTRQRGWNKGRSGTGSSTSSCVSAPPGSFVGPDGKVIDFTEEERLFLEQQFADMDKGKSDEPNIDMNDVMDEFGKFVQEEKLGIATDKAAECLGKLLLQKDEDEDKKSENKESESKEASIDIPAGIQKEAETDKTN
ncbi:unnamed protein product [Auanema sp. JU1783]|nr:unnamed protein product [Auanema sp. JU1783]